MDNKNEENYKNNVKQSNKSNEVDINNDKIIYLDNDKNQIYNREQDSGNILTNFYNTDNINPFTVAIDMWQNYINLWNESYKQLLFKNPPMANGEFLFMYWRSYSTKPKETQLS